MPPETEAIAAKTIQVGAIQSALASDPAELGILPAFQRVRSKFDVHVFESLPSTNTKLWEMLAAGAPAGTVVIACRQTAGRGQRGRYWQSSPGGLYLSLALEPHWPTSHIAQLTCISTWGIAIALQNLGLPVKIKWPNDLFYEGRKIGGILTETKVSLLPADVCSNAKRTSPSAYVTKAVIGVGLNWCNTVPKTAITLRDICALLPDSAAKNKINCLEMLAALVLKGILQGYLFHQQVGSQDFMKVYSDLLTQLGEVVSLDSDLLDRAIAPDYSSDSASLSSSALSCAQQDSNWQRGIPPDRLCQLRKRSGEVIGISEEGYLKVALRDLPMTSENDSRKVSSRVLASGTLASGSLHRSSARITDILLIKPAGAAPLSPSLREAPARR